MATIKMRTNDKSGVRCCECGNDQAHSLNMFDICIGGAVLTLCDICNGKVLAKTLRAECMVNGRVKTAHDMLVINERNIHRRLERHDEHININEMPVEK